jgi:CDP-ribitol ribitolphosphotransferase
MFLTPLLFLFYLLPRNERKIVYASARGMKLQGNLRAMYDALVRRYPSSAWRHVVLCRAYSYGFLEKLQYLLYLVSVSYHLQTATVVFLDNALFPVHIFPHKKATMVIQLWHATGALKPFGLDEIRADRTIENKFLHKHYDFVVADSERTKQAYIRAFGVTSNQVVILGFPRTDFLFDCARQLEVLAELQNSYPLPKGKKVVLYAPTFRGLGKNKRFPSFDVKKFRALLPSDVSVVAKPHAVCDWDEETRQVFDYVFPATEDINRLFTIADVFLTDYSSALFELLLIGKPLVLLTADLCDDDTLAGCYLDYWHDIPADYAEDEIVAATRVTQLLSGITQQDDEHRVAFLSDFCSHADGRATERVVDFIRPYLEKGNER